MIDERAVGLAATPYGFTQADLTEAVKTMSSAYPVEIRPLQRGGTGWDVEILLQFAYATFVALGPNLGASAIWDGLKVLFIKYRLSHPPERPSPLVTFKVADSSREVEAFVRTDDPECLSRAMSSLTDIVSATFDRSDSEWNYVEYDERAGSWRQVE